MVTTGGSTLGESRGRSGVPELSDALELEVVMDGSRHLLSSCSAEAIVSVFRSTRKDESRVGFQFLRFLILI